MVWVLNIAFLYPISDLIKRVSVASLNGGSCDCRPTREIWYVRSDANPSALCTERERFWNCIKYDIARGKCYVKLCKGSWTESAMLSRWPFSPYIQPTIPQASLLHRTTIRCTHELHSPSVQDGENQTKMFWSRHSLSWLRALLLSSIRRPSRSKMWKHQFQIILFAFYKLECFIGPKYCSPWNRRLIMFDFFIRSIILINKTSYFMKLLMMLYSDSVIFIMKL